MIRKGHIDSNRHGSEDFSFNAWSCCRHQVQIVIGAGRISELLLRQFLFLPYNVEQTISRPIKPRVGVDHVYNEALQHAEYVAAAHKLV